MALATNEIGVLLENEAVGINVAIASAETLPFLLLIDTNESVRMDNHTHTHAHKQLHACTHMEGLVSECVSSWFLRWCAQVVA